jgi:hypothetical protein
VRLFKSATGLPPMAYLARLRAEHAANLLLGLVHDHGSKLAILAQNDP